MGSHLWLLLEQYFAPSKIGFCLQAFCPRLV
jgi:hypothetical protein